MEKMKFELNDIVSFVHNSKTYVGRIVIRDFGGAYKYTNIHCYDVFIIEENFLLKHIREFELTLVKKYKVDKKY